MAEETWGAAVVAIANDTRAPRQMTTMSIEARTSGLSILELPMIGMTWKRTPVD
jgi:hypothetical protein